MAAHGSAVLCLGRDANGELGRDRSAPGDELGLVPLPAGSAIVRVGAGFFHSMAISSAGELYVWGAGSGGQLGRQKAAGEHPFGAHTGAHVGAATPTQEAVELGGSKQQCAAAAGGRNHTLAIATDGRVFSWGSKHLCLGREIEQQQALPVSRQQNQPFKQALQVASWRLGSRLHSCR